MKKSELENGMIVECRNGERYIVIRDFTKKTKHYIDDYDVLLDLNFGGYCSFYGYKENLTTSEHSYDIVKVYALQHCGSKKDELNLLWERKDNIKLISKQINILSKFYKINSHAITKEDDEYKILIHLKEGVEVETYISDKTVEESDEYNIYHFIESSIMLSIIRQYFKR